MATILLVTFALTLPTLLETTEVVRNSAKLCKYARVPITILVNVSQIELFHKYFEEFLILTDLA